MGLVLPSNILGGVTALMQLICINLNWAVYLLITCNKQTQLQHHAKNTGEEGFTEAHLHSAIKIRYEKHLMGEIKTFEQILHRSVILNNSRDHCLSVPATVLHTHLYLVGEDVDG